jgi:aryl-alcohol dehydrogenase-like predicted oxidoreductase
LSWGWAQRQILRESGESGVVNRFATDTLPPAASEFKSIPFSLPAPHHRGRATAIFAMEKRPLGRSGIRVSSVALGCMSLCATQTYPEIPVAQAIATVDAALDAGINFFDNAPMYGDGEAERRLGAALARDGKRKRAIIGTKISSETLSAAEVTRESEASLRRLQTDYIDLYQIHWPRRVVPLDETLRAMEDLVKCGKVCAIGVCNFGPLDLAEALEKRRVETNQLAYSLLARGVEFDVQPMCVERGIGLLCYSPLAQGLLTGRYQSADDVPDERARTRHFAGTRPQARHGQLGCEAETFRAIRAVRSISDELGVAIADVALAWLLQQPAVSSVLAGASRPEQVLENVRAASIRLDPVTTAKLQEATAPLKQQLGSNCDPWQAAGRIR